MSQVGLKTPILAPSWRILGVTLRILAPTLAEFLQKLIRHRAAGQKKIPRPRPDPDFLDFGPLPALIS